MAQRRLSMRKIREILRLKHEAGLSNRAIARACSIGKETVREYLGRAAEAGLNWPLGDGFSEETIERLLYPPAIQAQEESRVPDWAEIDRELRKKGVTRRLLWMEYKEAEPRPLSYSQFCDLYDRWAKSLDPVMRMTHKAGEKLFIDYAGLRIPYVCRMTGEPGEASVFVATFVGGHRK